MVLSEIQEVKDIGVPWLEVYGKGSWALISSLVNVASGIIEDTKHGDESVRSAVRAGNERTSGSNTVNVQTNSTSRLGDHSTCLEGIIDALDTVFFHVD